MSDADLEPGLPSTLYRSSNSYWPDHDLAEREEIGSGALFKMVRIALSDPDAEIWRYAISVAGRMIVGRDIAKVARSLVE